MFKKIIYFIMAALILLGIAGDWTRVEAEEMAVGLSFIYDKSDKGYRIIGEFLDVSHSNDPQQSQISRSLIMEFEARSPAEALQQNLQLEKALYGTHNRVRFFTEKMAQYGIEPIQDFFFREFYLDQRPIMMVVKNEDPLLLFQAETGLSDQVGGYIYALSRLKEERSTLTTFVTTLDFAKDLYKEGKQPIMGVVEVKENKINFDEDVKEEEEKKPKKYVMDFEGLAVFKEDKLVGYLDGQEAIAYNLISDTVRQAYIAIPVSGGNISIYVMESKSQVNTEYLGEDVNINIKIKTRLAIAENMSDYNISENKELKKAEKDINHFIQTRIKEAIQKVQTEFKSDIFGFGDYFHKDYPKKWKTIKHKWDDEYFAKVTINVTVENIIETEGHTRERVGERVYAE